MFNDHWEVTNVTEPLGASHVQSSTRVVGYAFNATAAVPVPTRHLVYAGVDGLVHELWAESGAWQLSTLTGDDSPRIANSPSAFTDFDSSSQYVFYISEQNEVVELRWTPGHAHVFGGPVKVSASL